MVSSRYCNRKNYTDTKQVKKLKKNPGMLKKQDFQKNEHVYKISHKGS